MEKCSQCGRKIGDDETPFVRDNRILCAKCGAPAISCESTPLSGRPSHPDYRDALLCSRFSMIAAACMIVAGIGMILNGESTLGSTFLLSAIPYWAISAALPMLRDIARNSWET